MVQTGLEDGDLFFWDLFDGGRDPRVTLEVELVDPGEYYRSVSLWPDAVASTRSNRDAEPVEQDFAMTLDSPAPASTRLPHTYADWLDGDWLTPKQKAFVCQDRSTAVRLKGPAGSGKTLALELKAIREVVQSGLKAPSRVLFATHSWAMAEQITSDLSILDPSGQADTIQVAPLLEVVKELRPPRPGLTVLGADSEEGRIYQRMYVEEVLDEFVNSDWITFDARCSAALRQRIDSVRDGETEIVDDLVHEFAVVMGGEGIQDGPKDEARYLGLPRTQRVMTLEDEQDRRAVYAIYSRFLKRTRQNLEITSDQFMATALHWFKDFEWGALRDRYGWEVIFVDELHLFNPQERGVLNHLGASPSSYPRLFMSLDPLQSTLGRFGAGGPDRAIEGSPEMVVLEQIHRFSPQILRLVQHINQTVPTEDFGEQWGLDLNTARSNAKQGPKPILVDASLVGGEVASAYAQAQQAQTRADRVAIAVVDGSAFGPFERSAERLAETKGSRVSLVRSRDDLGLLSRRGRGLVVGRAEDLAGLQFSEVVVAGFGDWEEIERKENRRLMFLAALYVAVSRASDRVTLVVDERESGMPTVLRKAVTDGIITRGRLS
jgi:superfamily I DNA/RNA helicase